MITIEFRENVGEEFYKMIGTEFDKYAKKNDVICNYTPFNFVAEEDGKIIGLITGHSYYEEVHIADLIVLEEYRKKHVGSRLIEEVERFYKNKGFKNINLTTYGFQAPEFYKKCGYEVEFVRENKENPKLTKYFLIKSLETCG